MNRSQFSVLRGEGLALKVEDGRWWVAVSGCSVQGSGDRVYLDQVNLALKVDVGPGDGRPRGEHYEPREQRRAHPVPANAKSCRRVQGSGFMDRSQGYLAHETLPPPLGPP